MPSDPLFYIVGLSTAFLISLGKGAFGGGLAMLGVPMLALVVDPLTASIMVAPLVSASDPFGIWAFPPRAWSWPDLTWLAPGMIVGLGIGALFFVSVDPRVVALGIAIVTLWFTGRWFLSGRARATVGAPVSPVKAILCGTVSGFTTFISHSGSPPIAYYLFPRGLPKTVLAGTLVAIFTIGNTVKLFAYLWLGARNPDALIKAAILLPMVPLGVWLGKLLHDRLDQHRLYFVCYLLVMGGGLKLLIDNAHALWAG